MAITSQVCSMDDDDPLCAASNRASRVPVR